MARTPQESADGTNRLLRRTMVLSGLLLPGGFLIAHLVLALRIMHGPQATQSALNALHDAHTWRLLERLGVGLSLGVHVVTACMLWWRGRTNNTGTANTPTEGTELPTGSTVILRVTGVIALLYLVHHVVTVGLPIAREEIASNDVHHHLSHIWDTSLAHTINVVGITAWVTHASIALHRVLTATTWGSGRVGSILIPTGCSLAGVTLWVLYLEPLWHFTLRCGGLLLHVRDVCF